MSNKGHDVLKCFAQIVIPDLGTLYFSLVRICGLPYGEQIVGTISSIDWAYVSDSGHVFLDSLTHTYGITPVFCL